MINYKEDITHLFSLFYLPVGEKIFCKTSGQTKTFCQVHLLTNSGYIVCYLTPPKGKTIYKPEEAKVHYTEITFNDIYAW